MSTPTTPASEIEQADVELTLWVRRAPNTPGDLHPLHHEDQFQIVRSRLTVNDEAVRDLDSWFPEGARQPAFGSAYRSVREAARANGGWRVVDGGEGDAEAAGMGTWQVTRGYLAEREAVTS